MDLLVRYYKEERPIMQVECKRIARAYAPHEAEPMQYVLETFFTLEDGVYRHSRCDEEIAKAAATAEKRKKSAAPKAPKAAPVEKPDDVSDQVWTEWLALRKAKRAQVTPFILDRIRKQAERVPAKYGFTFEDALLMMIDAQWTGFEAEWVVNRLSRTGGRATAAPQGFTRELSAEERARNPGFGITQEDIDEALTPLTPEEIAALSPHQDDVPPFDEALTLH